MTHGLLPPALTTSQCFWILIAPRRVVGSDAPGLATSTAHTAPMTESKPTKKLNGIPPGRCIHSHLGKEMPCLIFLDDH
jgi:hypothetical protein